MKNILNYLNILVAIFFFSDPLLFAESDHDKNDKVKHPKALQADIVGEASAPMVKPSTTNIEAYEHYVQGHNLWNKRLTGEKQTREYIFAATKHFEQAIALDPNYALAYSGLADALNAMRWRFPEDFMTHDARIAFNEGYTAKRNQALEKALALDLDLAEAHTLLGFIKRNNYDLRGAEKEFRLAIDLKPEYATTHHWYSVLLAWTGRFDEALMEGKRALEMDPMHHVYNSALALLLQMAGQDDAAIHQFQRTLTLHPERPGIQWHLNRMGVLYLKTERIEEAVDAFGRWSEQNAIAIDEETLRLFCKNVIEYRRTGKPMPLPPELKANPITGACFLEFIYVGTTKGDYIFNYYHNTEPTPGIFLAHLYAIMGLREKALESLEQAQNELGWLFTNIALLYAMLGEKEKAFEFIEEGYGESLYGDRDMMLLHLKVIPAFDPIRSEPRFIAFMRKVGLEEE